MQAIYRAVLKGSYEGQTIVNNLAYRVGVGVDVAGFAVGGADALAHCIKDQVWPDMKPCMPTGYTLESITAYPYHGETLELLYQNPYTLNVLEAGTGNNDTDGPAQCAIIKFNLEPTAILSNGWFPPKRGYVAVGPIFSGWINNKGQIIDEVFLDGTTRLNKLATSLAANLESLLPPVVFFPIRVKSQKVAGIWTLTSFADVGGAQLRRNASYRRSRMIE